MCALLFAAIFAQLLRKSISKILTNAAEIACQGTVYLRAKSRRCAAVALRNAPAGAVTPPYRFAVAATHKIHHSVGAGHAPPATVCYNEYYGSSVGAAYMPPVAAAPAMQPNG